MKILKEITPSRWEKYIVNRRVSSILEELKKDIPSLTIELGGSFEEVLQKIHGCQETMT